MDIWRDTFRKLSKDLAMITKGKDNLYEIPAFVNTTIVLFKILFLLTSESSS